MKNRRLALAALLAVPMAFSFMGMASASDQDFKVINKTGYQIDSIYVSKHSSNSWEEDVLGQDSLEDGAAVNIRFAAGTRGCIYDLKVTYSDSDTSQWGNINLCEVSSVTLYWDRKNNTTRAVTN